VNKVITITISKASRNAYRVAIGNNYVLLEKARCPFLEAARKLVAEGLADPDDTLQMRTADGPVSLVGKVGDAAKLTVIETEERGPYFAPYKGGISPETKGRLQRERPHGDRQDQGQARVVARGEEARL
jgi:hypothetical protein